MDREFGQGIAACRANRQCNRRIRVG
jgi:hypothetical protein